MRLLAQAASRRDLSTTLDMTVGEGDARDDRGGEGTLDMTYYARDDMKKGARITANSFCQQSMND